MAPKKKVIIYIIQELKCISKLGGKKYIKKVITLSLGNSMMSSSCFVVYCREILILTGLGID
jgi:hypothetical protein